MSLHLGMVLLEHRGFGRDLYTRGFPSSAKSFPNFILYLHSLAT